MSSEEVRGLPSRTRTMAELAWLTARPGTAAARPARGAGGQLLLPPRPTPIGARPASSDAGARGGGGGGGGRTGGSSSSSNNDGESSRARVRPRSAVGADTIARIFAVQHEKKVIEHECRVRCRPTGSAEGKPSRALREDPPADLPLALALSRSLARSLSVALGRSCASARLCLPLTVLAALGEPDQAAAL